MLKRTASRPNSRRESSAYKKKIESVKHRVDCWNKTSLQPGVSEMLSVRQKTPLSRSRCQSTEKLEQAMAAVRPVSQNRQTLCSSLLQSETLQSSKREVHSSLLVNKDLNATGRPTSAKRETLSHRQLAVHRGTLRQLQQLMNQMQTTCYDVKDRACSLVEQRQASRYAQHATKEFKQLVRQLEDQFESMKTQIQEQQN